MKGSLSFIFIYLFLLFLWCPEVSPTSAECFLLHDYEFYVFESPFDSKYSYLYQQFEKALLSNHGVLEKARTGFISSEGVDLDFHVELEVVSGKNTACKDLEYFKPLTFCPFKNDTWRICDAGEFDQRTLDITFTSKTVTDWLFEDEGYVMNMIQWLSFLHGNLVPIPQYMYGYAWMDGGDYEDGQIDVKLKIDKLDCNPPLALTKCVLSELFSWIKVYSEVGGKPQTWDQSQKGTVAFDGTDYDYKYMEFMKQPIGHNTFTMLGLSEYILVSLALSLVLAAFFPAVHNQIVSRATRLEHQSFYWGTVIVSNIYVYGLVFLLVRGYFIYFQSYSFYFYLDMELLPTVLYVQEVVVNVIMFVGALAASLRSSHHTVNPQIPRGFANVMIMISFCFSCFCCCVHCFQRRAKMLRILILFSFMSFIYHNCMDVISFVFLMFVKETRALVVTFTVLYISLVVFIIVFFSLLLFIVFRGRYGAPYEKYSKCLGAVCLLMIVFGAVMLMVIMYMIIVFTLNLKGLTGIVTGLVPSIALSAASWYIKKRLEKESQSDTATNQSQHETTGEAMNDGEREETEDTSGDQRLLLP